MRLSAKARAPGGLFASQWRAGALRIWGAALDLLYPPRCAGCGQLDTPWCAGCQRRLDQAEGMLRLDAPPPLTASAAGGWHEGLARDAVHALKFEACRAMADVLGERMAAALRAQSWPAELLIPVPLHATRLKERGYNQAEWLAEAVASRSGLACVPHALVRNRSTPHQVGASAAERRANMVGAFEPAGDALRGRHIVLLDDVFTTGATLQACAQAALSGGALSVYSLTATAARPAGTV
jgi:ComF family protein